MNRLLNQCLSDKWPDPVMDDHHLCIFRQRINSIFHRVLSPPPSWNDLGDLSVVVFLNDLIHAVIHILLADDQDDGVNQRTGLEFIQGMSEDGFSGQEVKLFLLSFHEAVALPSRNNYCVSLHHPTTKLHGMLEYWIFHLSIIPIRVASQVKFRYRDCSNNPFPCSPCLSLLLNEQRSFSPQVFGERW